MRAIESRWTAGGIHFAISIVIAIAVSVLMLALWYPGAIFRATGGQELFFLVVGVDVVIGPLITLIIYNRKKKELKFDLTVVAALQIVALAYGLWIVAEVRPVYMAHNNDRFELIPANALDEERLAKADPLYQQLSLTGPVTVGTKLPADPDEQYKIMTRAIKGGDDIQYFPQYYVPFEQAKDSLRRYGKQLGELTLLNPDNKDEVDVLLRKYSKEASNIRFFPLKAKRSDVTVIVDVSSARVLDIVALHPW